MEKSGAKSNWGKWEPRVLRKICECSWGKSTGISNLDLFPEWEIEKSETVCKQTVGLCGSLGDSCKKKQRLLLKTGHKIANIRFVMKMREK